MNLSEKTVNAILELQKRYPEKRSALIPALHLAQKEHGYLPRHIQDQVASLFGIAPNEVNAVVTFYEMFFEKPAGKHVIHVCKNLSCMLRGGDEILETFCTKLGTEPGAPSPDGEFSVIASECLAACDRAPMALVDETVVGPIRKEEIDTILENAKKGKGHPSPVTFEEGEDA
jgi:NADH-quinone oxidoreductase subunit E